MVDEYTWMFFPVVRGVGGSYVPNFYAEAFWNFGFLGALIFLFVFFYLLDMTYFIWVRKIRREAKIDNVFFFSSYAFMLFLFRGSGIDLFGLFVILFYLMSRLYRIASFVKW